MVDEDFVILVVVFVVVLVTEGVVVLFFVAELFAVVEVGEFRVTMPEFEEEFAVVDDFSLAEFTEVSLEVDVGESCKS